MISPALVALLAPPAQAAEPFSPPGLIDLLPTGDVLGDGLTPVALHVLALDPTGSPIQGLELKPTSKLGAVGPWTPLGNGVYRVDVTPPEVDDTYPLEVKLKGKTPAKEPVSLLAEIRLLPPLSTRLTATANPTELELGDETAASNLSLSLDGGAGQLLPPEQLLLRATAGEILNLTDMGGGKLSARYEPPDTDIPQLAIITAADRRDPDRVYAHATITLVADREQVIEADPGASVLLKVGDRQFGPVEASSSGRAVVPITLGPGITSATAISVKEGVSRDFEVDLELPETPRIQLFPPHPGLPGSTQVQVPVRAAVRTADGAPDPGAMVTFTTSAGFTSPARHEGDGVYVADLTPPQLDEDGTITVQATLGGEQQSEATIPVVGARAAKVDLSASPPVLPADAKELTVTVRASAADGSGLPGRTLALFPTGAKVADIQDVGDGTYTVTMTTTGSGPVEVFATVTTTATGNPMERMVMVSQNDAVRNDGISSNLLTLVTLDEFGYPVANVPVDLEVRSGGGSLPASTTTGAFGLGQVFYTAGRDPGLVRVAATAGDRSITTAFLQLPGSVEGPSVPVSGSATAIALDDAWRSSVAFLRIERGD